MRLLRVSPPCCDVASDGDAECSVRRSASHRDIPSAWPHRPYNPHWLALTPGPRLVPYEATAQIGVGGGASPARQRLTVTFLG